MIQQDSTTSTMPTREITHRKLSDRPEYVNLEQTNGLLSCTRVETMTMRHNRQHDYVVVADTWGTVHHRCVAVARAHAHQAHAPARTKITRVSSRRKNGVETPNRAKKVRFSDRDRESPRGLILVLISWSFPPVPARPRLLLCPIVAAPCGTVRFSDRDRESPRGLILVFISWSFPPMPARPRVLLCPSSSLVSVGLGLGLGGVGLRRSGFVGFKPGGLCKTK